MKNGLYLLVAFLLTISAGCKKNNKADDPAALIGSWEYRKTICNCVTTSTPEDHSPGNGNILTFTGSTYKHYKKSVLIDSGTYVIVKDSQTSSRNRIIYNNDTQQSPTFYKIDDNMLIFYGTVSIAADGTEVHYERQ